MRSGSLVLAVSISFACALDERAPEIGLRPFVPANGGAAGALIEGSSGASGGSACPNGSSSSCDAGVLGDSAPASGNACDGTAADELDENCACTIGTERDCPPQNGGCRTARETCVAAPGGTQGAWSGCAYTDRANGVACEAAGGLEVCRGGECVAVACVRDADCTSLDASSCLDNRCVPCAGDAACARFEGLQVCDEQAGCVQCSLANPGPCNGFTCDRVSRQCTNVVVGSAALCDSCVADAQCVSGARCARQTFGGVTFDPQCWPLANTVGCPRPYTQMVRAQTVDGATENLCMFALTTCAGFDAYSERLPCTDASECGASGVGDGLCEELGEGLVCTVACTSPLDCTSACLGDLCVL